MFDTNAVPNYRTNTTTYIAQLPDEIVANCLSFVAANPKQALEMRLVSLIMIWNSGSDLTRVKL